MTKPRGASVGLTLTGTQSDTLQWDAKGKCSESINGGRRHRRSDLDFGTRIGNLLVDPWVQDILRKAKK
jgi:hypothetical protein